MDIESATKPSSEPVVDGEWEEHLVEGYWDHSYKPEDHWRAIYKTEDINIENFNYPSKLGQPGRSQGGNYYLDARVDEIGQNPPQQSLVMEFTNLQTNEVQTIKELVELRELELVSIDQRVSEGKTNFYFSWNCYQNEERKQTHKILKVGSNKWEKELIENTEKADCSEIVGE